MDKIKKSCLFRTISLVLIFTFISLDISYAYPPEHNAGNSTLAAPSVLQQTPINENAARFQQSVFSQNALIASVYDIGEYFFGNAQKSIGSLPSKYAEDALRADLSKHLIDAGTEILNIVPVEYIKQTVPDKLKAALDEIGFRGTLPDEGVVFILYRKGGKKFLVQIARKDQVSSDSLPGYEWVVSDKYVVKYMPEDYKGSVAQVAQAPTTPVTPAVETKQEAQPIISELIAQVEVPTSKAGDVQNKPLSIKAILNGLSGKMYSFEPLSLALGSFWVLSILSWLKDLAFAHPVITIAELGIGIALSLILWRVIRNRITGSIKRLILAIAIGIVPFFVLDYGIKNSSWYVRREATAFGEKIEKVQYDLYYRGSAYPDPLLIPAHMKALEHKDADVRIMAIRGLAIIERAPWPWPRDPLIAPVFIKVLLEDKNVNVRKEALRVLGERYGCDVIEDALRASAFIKALGDEDASIQIEVIEQLRKHEISSAVPALTKILLENKNSDVRKAAARSLHAWSLNAPSSVPALIKALEAAAQAFRESGDLSEIKTLIDSLTSLGGDDIKAVTHSSEGSAKSPIAQAFIKALEKVTKAVGDSKNPSAIPTFFHILRTNGFDVQKAAILSFSAVEEPTLISTLIKALNSEKDSYVQTHIVEALGELEDPSAAYSVLLKVLDEKRANCKGEGDSTNYQGFSLSSYKDYFTLRNAAMWPIAKIAAKNHSPALIKSLWEIGYTEAAIEPLTELLQNASLEVRKTAVQGLYNTIGAEEVVVKTEYVLGWNEIGRRSEMAYRDYWSYERIKGDKAIEPLIKALLTDSDADIRQNAFKCLDKIGDLAVSALKKHLENSTSSDDKKILLEAIDKIGGEREYRYPKTLESISTINNSTPQQEPIKPKSSEPKQGASVTLPSINPFAIIFGVAALGSVFSIAKDFVYEHPIITTIIVIASLIVGTRQLIFLILKTFSPIGWNVLELCNKDAAYRKAAADNLDKLGWKPKKVTEEILYSKARLNWDRLVEIGIPAVPVLIRALGDEDASIRASVAEALGKIKDTRAIDALVKVLMDKDETVRDSAETALGNIVDRSTAKEIRRGLEGDDEYQRNIAMNAAKFIKLEPVNDIEQIIFPVMQELEKRKEMSFQELFSLVQSNVPAAMENLTNALKELKPLCEKPGLLVDEMSAAIKQVKARYKLSDDEIKILWLALTGPGQGGGRIERISAIRDCLSNIVSYLAKRDELPQEADLLMVLGSNNMKVPIEAARLFKNLKIKKILVSGFGPADKKGTAMTPEAYIFRDKLIAEGVPAGTIETEAESTSTKDNIERSKKMLEDMQIPHDTVILITFPTGQRIAGETFKKQFGRDAINHAAYLPSLSDIAEKDLLAEAGSIYMHLTRLTYYGPSGKAEIGAIDIPAEICQAQEKLRELLLSVETEDMVSSDKLDYDHARAKALIKIKLTEQSVRYKFNKVSPGHIEKAMEIMAAGNDFIINPDSLDIEEVKMEASSTLALTGPGQGAGEAKDEADAQVSEEASQPKPDIAQKATQLFEIVEFSLNNERAKYIEAGNKIVGGLDKDMATAEIRQRVEKAIAAIGSLDKEGVTPETKTAVELLKKNLNQFEADGAVGSLIVLARKAKKENQKLIIGLETDWIPGMNVGNSLQRQAITALMKEIDSIAEALQSMGLDNVEVIRGSGSQLASTILNEAEKTHTKMHNIVVMASANTINSDGFAALRGADESDRPFLTGIDPTELIKLYTEFGESVSKQLYIRLASLLYMTLELAAGKEPPQSPIIISYDKKLRILMLLPKADPIDYEVLKNTYAAEKIALAAA